MTANLYPLPKLRVLPSTLPLERAVRIELEDGVPVFKATRHVQARIEKLLEQERRGGLDSRERKELDRYEEVDDYLSWVNRVVRNLMKT
ncbi:hypothetical protein FBQ82_01055 [Anaerolineae bacterium CFX7]|nr:hypothetical protein [Anaerolineae bacterium CFX7]